MARARARNSRRSWPRRFFAASFHSVRQSSRRNGSRLMTSMGGIAPRLGDMEQGSKPRSVKIGDDERLGWSSERPRRDSGPRRPEDISTRNRVLKPSEELMYS